MTEIKPRRTIPIAAAHAHAPAECAGAEPFALMVLGDSMAPELLHGDIVVIEPEGLATDGAFVLARRAGDWVLRQLRTAGARWTLVALDAAVPPDPIDDLACVHGVVIQRSRGRGRRGRVHYPDGVSRGQRSD